MSDLRYQTPDQLRFVIARSVAYRADQLAAAEMAEEQAAALLAAAAEYRKKYHNVGQRETWARIWLARKETGQVE
jgi:hypothetical protein